MNEDKLLKAAEHAIYLNSKPKEGDLCYFWDDGKESEKVKGYYIEQEYTTQGRYHLGSLRKVPEFGCLISYDNVRFIEDY